MDTPPTPSPAQQIADLRETLQGVVPVLCFAAGRAAEDSLTDARALLTAAAEVATVLERTAPVTWPGLPAPASPGR
ncbi:hypothetical protein C0Q98_31730 [Streptomyces albidoflavus]|uniref:hypothetical protein n=1 Tax=Streptomyces albidoflavus TaxID=1886 RepID=UPI00101FCA45|nr:hypothetical protein [Streptomyces albidoflavus]RZE50708.1 hypothetical protein C0Q98_31730 [Streptomyces albidoflavus]